MKNQLETLEVKNAIRLIMGGYMFDDGDIMNVPEILKEIANDYTTEIKKQSHATHKPTSLE